MKKLCLVAVDIRSAHNVGAFFRTCDAFGAELILIGISPRPKSINDDRLPHIAERAHNSIAKTGLGSEHTVAWRYFTDWSDAFAFLREKNFLICAIEQTLHSKPIETLRRIQNTALVVGPEVQGLNPDIIKTCDSAYQISMKGKKESLNVSVAAGIALYQASL